jgi:hypothetical protein
VTFSRLSRLAFVIGPQSGLSSSRLLKTAGCETAVKPGGTATLIAPDFSSGIEPLEKSGAFCFPWGIGPQPEMD